MVAKSACVVGGRHEGASKGVHLSQRADSTCVAEIVAVGTSCKRRAGCRLNSDKPVVSLTSELFAHERGHKSAKVGTAACAADYHIRLDAVFVHCYLRFKTDHRLVQQYL